MARRVWLNPDNAALPQAAAWLIDHAADPDNALTPQTCDLRRVICVTPGRRSNRLLLGSLLDRLRELGRHLIPPQPATPGVLLEKLSNAKPQQTANQLEVVSAWLTALREADEEATEPLMRVRPDREDLAAWRRIAVHLADVSRELAGAGKTFADAQRVTASMDLPVESTRWSVIDAIHRSYLQRLEASGLTDPNAASLQAIKSTTTCDEMIVLVGVTDLNALQRDVLASVGDRVTALIHADETEESAFDEWGCVVEEAWRERPLKIDSQRIRIADRPMDQAQAALDIVADWSGDIGPNDVTLAMADESLSPVLRLAASWADVPLHDATGVPMDRSRPHRLLASIGAFLRDQRFAQFAGMIRHPDVERYISNACKGSGSGLTDWLNLLDRYFEAHLQERVDGRWLGTPETQQELKRVWQAAMQMCKPLMVGSMPLSDWSQPIREVLLAVYGDVEGDDRTATLDEALKAIRPVIDDLALLPAALSPHVTSTQALEWVLAELDDVHLRPQVRTDEVDLVGWLEVHLDDAPNAVVVGVHDGALPQAVHGDLFLPEILRAALGLMNNRRRLARDKYLLQAVLRSRRRVTLVAARRGADNEPLAPSRLLLACDDATLIERVKLLCGDEPARTDAVPRGLSSPAISTAFTIPECPVVEPPSSMSVTEFGQFLTCGYRYALRRLVGLEKREMCESELDAASFGELVHEALSRFGQDESSREMTDPSRIALFLNDALREIARNQFGTAPSLAVRFQIDAAARRLQEFAKEQAGLRAGGWRIVDSERAFGDGAFLDVIGQDRMALRGKIDRIDVHESTQAVRIIDYKTSDTPRTPFETHHGRKTLPKDGSDPEWINLQLPLYEYLWRQAEGDDDTTVTLAYINLPKVEGGVSFEPAGWNQGHIEGAIELACDVVRRIRAGITGPPADVGTHDDFARICQTAVLSGLASGEDGGGFE